MSDLGDGERPPEQTMGELSAQTDPLRGPKSKTQRQSLANERAARAVDLRTRGSKTYQQIGEELGITPQAAKAAYERGVKMLVPREEIDEARQVALAKLDQWEQMMIEEYHREVVMVNFGKVIHDDSGAPMLDFSHRQGIMDRLIKIERERRAVQGYQAPSKRVLEVITADMFDKAIKQLNAEAAELERQHQEAETEAGLKALMRDNSIIDAEIVEEDEV